jgi:hypothetical protein
MSQGRWPGQALAKLLEAIFTVAGIGHFGKAEVQSCAPVATSSARSARHLARAACFSHGPARGRSLPADLGSPR